jgi:hypothetical protein
MLHENNISELVRCLLAERGKYRLRPRRSPRQHKQTTAHNQARQVEGTQNQPPGIPWFYRHCDTFYKRALSGFLVIASGFNNSVPEVGHNCGRPRREVPAPEDPEDKSLDGSLKLTDWV